MIFLSPCRFQSTFPRGERHLCWLVAVKHIHFNPRSLVGNDYIPVGTYTIVEISIHVPSWGTTIFTRRQPPCILFQSTFPRGERQDPSERQAAIAQFQSTFPRGERQSGNLYLLPDRGFQSTFPRGERLLGKFIVPGHYHFNPRSLVGNDGIQQAINADTVAFQSTFPRGERRWKNLNVRCRRLFQSTFPRGERPDTRKMGMAHTNFNPRSLVGNDIFYAGGAAGTTYFNPRSLVGNDGYDVQF